jgi:hypothetical protein
MRGKHLNHWTTNTSVFSTEQKQQKSISRYLPEKSRNLLSYITECGSSEKFEIVLEVSTNRAENFFLKYLLYFLYEIARKYPREKKYSSSFYDSVDPVSSLVNLRSKMFVSSLLNVSSISWFLVNEMWRAITLILVSVHMKSINFLF